MKNKMPDSEGQIINGSFGKAPRVAWQLQCADVAADDSSRVEKSRNNKSRDGRNSVRASSAASSSGYHSFPSTLGKRCTSAGSSFGYVSSSSIKTSSGRSTSPCEINEKITDNYTQTKTSRQVPRKSSNNGVDTSYGVIKVQIPTGNENQSATEAHVRKAEKHKTKALVSHMSCPEKDSGQLTRTRNISSGITFNKLAKAMHRITMEEILPRRGVSSAPAGSSLDDFSTRPAPVSRVQSSAERVLERIHMKRLAEMKRRRKMRLMRQLELETLVQRQEKQTSSKENASDEQQSQGSTENRDDSTKDSKYGSEKSLQLIPDEYDNKNIQVDPAPMIKYLTLVKLHPEQYYLMKNTANNERKPVRSLLALGQVYARRNEEPGCAESLVMRAAYEISSKVYTGSAPSDLEKELGVTSPTSKKMYTKYIEAREPGRKLSEHDENKTPLERARDAVQEWMSKLTTAQIVKGREMALRELGEDDKSLKRWWVAHKYCRYLRQRTLKNNFVA